VLDVAEELVDVDVVEIAEREDLERAIIAAAGQELDVVFG